MQRSQLWLYFDALPQNWTIAHQTSYEMQENRSSVAKKLTRIALYTDVDLLAE